MNSAVIADSPEQLLWAGIGDALSKEYEAVFSSKDDTLSHTPLMGKQISRICTDPLTEYGAEALESIREKESVVRARPGDARHYYIDRHRLEHDEHS